MESTSARDLDRRLADLVRSERHLAVQFVVELAAFAKLELYRELGYTSLFTYCVRQLGLSKSAAFRRSEVARLIARFPAIAARLAEGRASIRALVELRQVLTEENHALVLARAEGKSQEEAQLLAVEIKPRPVPRDVIRVVSAQAHAALPAQAQAALPAPAAGSAQQPLPPSPQVATAVVPAGTSTAPRQSEALPDAVVPAGTTQAHRPTEVVKPLTPELRRLNVTVSADFIDELEQVRAALSHTCPDGNFERVVRAAFKLVLERDRKRKGLTGRSRSPPQPQPPQQPRAQPQPPQQPRAQPQPPQQPRAQPQPPQQPRAQPQPPQQPRAQPPPPREAPDCSRAPPEGDRYIPAAVKRAVWERDRGRCTWPMGDGQVCGSTHRLELDHELELALGGKSTLANIGLLCKSHNLLKAERHLGRGFMAKFRKSPTPERDTS